MAQKESNLHLTELILSIHNEVQSAVDYISEVAQQEGTELGKSSALMGIQTLRVKLPFELAIEQKTGNVSTPVLDADRLSSIKKNLLSRRGFSIDMDELNKKALLTKVKVLSLSRINDPAVGTAEDQQVEKAIAELEISFSPFKRD